MHFYLSLLMMSAHVLHCVPSKYLFPAQTMQVPEDFTSPMQRQELPSAATLNPFEHDLQIVDLKSGVD